MRRSNEGNFFLINDIIDKNNMELYSERIEALIHAALVDGELTDKERQVLMKKATEEGIDQDEFEMVLNARLFEIQQAQKTVSQSEWGKNKVRTCPNCGATISDNFLTCPECGFTFVNESSISKSIRDYLKQFDDELNTINRFWQTNKRVDKITSLKVPNTKEALMQAIIYCVGKNQSETITPLKIAWKSKARELYHLVKAQPSIDQATQAFINQYAYLEKKSFMESYMSLFG